MKKQTIIEKKSRTTIYLSFDKYLKLKMAAAEERKSMGELIEEWILSWKKKEA